MSDESENRDRRLELSTVIERFGRKGGSAHRADKPAFEIWQRVVDLVPPQPAARRRGRQATGPVREVAPQPAAQSRGRQATGPVREVAPQPAAQRAGRPATGPVREVMRQPAAQQAGRPASRSVREVVRGGPTVLNQRVVELSLPTGASVRVLGQVEVVDEAFLRVHLDPAPTNTAHVIALLQELAAGRGLAAASSTAAGSPFRRPTSEHAAVARDVSSAAAQPQPAVQDLAPIPDEGLGYESLIQDEQPTQPIPRPAEASPRSAISAGTIPQRAATETIDAEEARSGPQGTVATPPSSPASPGLQEAQTGAPGHATGRQGPTRGGAAARWHKRPMQRPPTGPCRPAARATDPQASPADQASWIGVDLGTLFARAAVVRGSVVEPILDETGAPHIPSLISFPAPGEVLVGRQVEALSSLEAEWTLTPRRLLGRSQSQPALAPAYGDMPLHVFADNGALRVNAHGAVYSAPELCALILSQVRAAARRQLGREVGAIALAVPVAFDVRQRAALRAAAQHAGLAVKAMLTEPGAALLGCGLRRPGGVAAVFSLGATFAMSLVECSETSFHVVESGGDLTLGGEALDAALADELADRCRGIHGVDPRDDPAAWDRLLWEGSAAKEGLSTREAVEVDVRARWGAEPRRFRVTRADLLPLLQPLVQRALDLADQLLQRASIRSAELDALVLAGGLCRFPDVHRAVSEHFAISPTGGDADLAVARGMALRAAELAAAVEPPWEEAEGAVGRQLGLGVGGKVAPLVFPAAPQSGPARQRLVTERDGQTEIVVAIYEASTEEDWRVLGQLRYTGLPALPAGQAVVELAVWHDAPQLLRLVAAISGREYETQVPLA